ncbi:MAG: glycoside hydrolase family 9 protein, partial [Catalinimonas sp.]
AYAWAERQPDPMLDVDVDGLRARDLKMTAAAYLYNLTGEPAWEQATAAACAVAGPTDRVRNPGRWEQQYAAVAYLKTPRPVRFPDLQTNLRAALLHQAKTDYLSQMAESPTGAARWANQWEGTFQTSNEMSVVALAHHFSDDPAERAYLATGLYSEAEWTLGRNPLGLVQMTGLTDRCVTQTFAPGRRDGYPGLTPGWTPYLCRDGWDNADDIHRCQWYTNRNYPADKEVWPWGEHFWNSRYSVPNAEATPHQNFRQKVVLYGYLYALGRLEGR